MELTVYENATQTQKVVWEGKRLTIGRRSSADIQVKHPTISGLHAEIVPTAQGGIRLRDLDSRNGTQVNGVRVVESALHSGDHIQVGGTSIVVSGRLAPKAVPEPTQDLEETEFTPSPESWNGLQTEKMSIQLDTLRQQPAGPLNDDKRILLLRDLFEALREVDDTEEVLMKVRVVMSKAFPKARVFILRMTPKGSWRDRETTLEGRRPSSTFAAEAAQSDSAILSSSLREDTRFSFSESVQISGIQTAIATPIRCAGQALAVLYVDRLGLPPFNPRDLHLLGIAANHVSAVLENVARIADLKRTNEELDQARQHLAALNTDLEGLVEERTAEVRRQANRIADLAKAKDELLGIAAHDIRGPLTVIQGTVELMRLRRDHLVEATLNRSLDLIHDAARGLSQLLTELLDVKAIEAGKITINKDEIHVAHLIDQYLPSAHLAAEDKKIELRVEVEEDLTVFADAQRLSQAMTNLLLNAVKFSKSGSRILLQGKSTADGFAEISVEDQGVGIPDDELEKIFDSFGQGRAGKAMGGSGLGLVIARRIVDLHGGRLTVNSKVGVGTRFVIGLPASLSQAAAQAS